MILSDVSKLTRWSKELILCKCDNCGIEREIRYCNYITYGYDNNNYMCPSCKRKSNLMKKYGVENVFQLKEVKEKSKKTNLEKYGVENVSQSVEIQKKVKDSLSKLDKNKINQKRIKTVKRKYGVENVSQLDEVKKLKEETTLNNYGVKYISQLDSFKDYLKELNMLKYGVPYMFQSEEIKERIKETNLERYGFENPSMNTKIKKQIKESVSKTLNERRFKNIPNLIKIENSKLYIKCEKCDEIFNIEQFLFYKRRETNKTICTLCNPLYSGISEVEKELFNYISSIYNDDIIENYRDGLEIDIYLPKLNIGFEFNGVYWHSLEQKDNDYHLNKTLYFREKGIKILHIWENDWINENYKIRTMISNLINGTYIEKYNIKKIDEDIFKNFYNKNSIFSYIESEVFYGMFSNNDMISVISIDNNMINQFVCIYGYNQSDILNKFIQKLNINFIMMNNEFNFSNFDNELIIIESFEENIIFNNVEHNVVKSGYTLYKIY